MLLTGMTTLACILSELLPHDCLSCNALYFGYCQDYFHETIWFLASAWLAKPKANVVIPENQPLPNYLRKKKKTSKSAKYRLPLRYKKDL